LKDLIHQNLILKAGFSDGFRIRGAAGGADAIEILSRLERDFETAGLKDGRVIEAPARTARSP
jgi:hypothetical protein